MKTTDEKKAERVMAWETWKTYVLEPAVLDEFDAKDPDQAKMAGTIKEIAAAAFNAGHDYGFARRTDPGIE